jgi:hypothetical protein
MINDFGITIWTLGGDESGRIYNEANFDMTEIIISICVMSRAHEESVLKRQRIYGEKGSKDVQSQGYRTTLLEPDFVLAGNKGEGGRHKVLRPNPQEG